MIRLPPQGRRLRKKLFLECNADVQKSEGQVGHGLG
jgi:hypothetical protein